jgi:hypothetical protein
MSGRNVNRSRNQPAELIITNPRELSWLKTHLPGHHKAALRAIKNGSAIITQEAPGCRV